MQFKGVDFSKKNEWEYYKGDQERGHGGTDIFRREDQGWGVLVLAFNRKHELHWTSLEKGELFSQFAKTSKRINKLKLNSLSLGWKFKKKFKKKKNS